MFSSYFLNLVDGQPTVERWRLCWWKEGKEPYYGSSVLEYDWRETHTIGYWTLRQTKQKSLDELEPLRRVGERCRQKNEASKQEDYSVHGQC